jgi:telomerase reverse transcriptase
LNSLTLDVCLLTTLRRYESISSRKLIEKMKVTSANQIAMIPWIKSGRATSFTPSDAIKRVQLLEQLLYWVLHDYLLPLLGVHILDKANFYITETGIHKYKLFYFRHKIWTRINAPLFKGIMQSMYEVVDETAVKKAQNGYNTLAVATMRLLPKQRGARPIVNLSKKQQLRPNYKNSVNGLLKNVFHVLLLEKVQINDAETQIRFIWIGCDGKE